MKISVKVKPNAKQDKIEQINEGSFLIWVKEKPQEGKANKAVIKALAEYFEVPQSEIILLRGQTAREKFFEIKINKA
jgi:uncharacterized protein (TIGR00251 family)